MSFLHKKLLNIPKLFLIFSLLFSSYNLWAQLTLKSNHPLTSDKLEFVYDAGQGNKALFGLQEDLYFHTGVITANSRDAKDWKFAIGDWGKADSRVKMTALGGDKYRFEITPDKFYGYPKDTKVQQLAFVFRNEKGNKVGKTADETDILIPVNNYKPPLEKSKKYLYQSRNFVSYTLKNNQLKIQTTHGVYLFTPYSSDIVHVECFASDSCDSYSSRSVILRPENRETEMIENCESLTFLAGNVHIDIQKDPFRVEFLYNSDFLFEEEKGFFERSDNQGFRFKLSSDEHIFGTGERAVPLDRRGFRFELYNRPDYNYGLGAQNLNFTLPLYLSSRKYLVLFDNPQKGYFDIGHTEDDIMEFGAIGGEMNYYVVMGDSFEEIDKNYTALTGRQPLPPRWALGNLQSRMAYRTQAELEGVVDSMQAKDFPLDAVIIDFYWFGDSIKGGLGNLKWYKKNWPEPEKMIANFKKKGVKTILITEPMVIDTAYWFTYGDTMGLFAKNSQGKTYIMKDFYFGPGALMDIFKQETKDWFWEQYNKQIKIGVAGWWGDLGEPETHPSDMIHVNGTADEVHNIFALEWEKMLFEKYQKNYPKRRLFHLNRAGAPGSQRYSVFPWSGDVSRSWSGLQAQLPLMLNMSISGLGYISSDLGGFALGEKDEDLYRRWLQFGVFNPIFRPHGSGIPSEPIFFSQKTQDIVRKAIKLRYRLMPYLYTLSYQNTSEGKPIVKPLFYMESDNKDLFNYSDAYLFGDDFLVAPVIQPKQDSIEVYFPKGFWYNFYTDQRVFGGTKIKLKVNEETIPVFVKAGSIIAMLPDFNSTDNYPSALNVHYYPKNNAETHALVYEDDGKSYSSIQDGKFQKINFAASNAPRLLHFLVETDQGEYKGKAKERSLSLIVHNCTKKPNKIYLNGHLLKRIRGSKGDYSWDKEKKLLRIKVLWENQDLDIRIEK